MKMAGITGFCSKLVQAIGATRPNSSCLNQDKPSVAPKPLQAGQLDEATARALRSVFGMKTNGKIKKEKAHQVVKKLGLVYCEAGEDKSAFDLPGSEEDDEMAVAEVLDGLEDGSDRQHQLLLEAFKIFDEDGNGYIEAMELKRVLECLGLDKGWEISDIEKMLKVVDLNLDGKVDFSEFELMMA